MSNGILKVFYIQGYAERRMGLTTYQSCFLHNLMGIAVLGNASACIITDFCPCFFPSCLCKKYNSSSTYMLYLSQMHAQMS